MKVGVKHPGLPLVAMLLAACSWQGTSGVTDAGYVDAGDGGDAGTDPCPLPDRDMLHTGFEEVNEYGALRLSYLANVAHGFDFSDGAVAYSDRDLQFGIIDLISQKEVIPNLVSDTCLKEYRVRPSICRGIAVSSGSTKDAGEMGIYLFSLNENEERRLPLTGIQPSLPEMYGDTIVWDDSRHLDEDGGYNVEIYSYDLITGQERRITHLPLQQSHPRLNEDWIVWTDGQKWMYKEDIVLYERATGRMRWLTDDDTRQLHPDIDGDLVVWTDLRNGTVNSNGSYQNSDIYLYRISTGETRQLTSDPADQDRPDIDGKWVAWTDYRYGEKAASGMPIASNVFVHNLETGEEKQVTFGEGWVEASPKLSGDQLVYVSYETREGVLWLVDLKRYWADEGK